MVMAYDEKAGEEVAPKGVGSPRVLLVDDNPDDRALVERELRKDAQILNNNGAR